MLGRGLRLAVAGLVLGLGCAMLATRLLAGQLYDVTPHDATTYAAAIALLGVMYQLARNVGGGAMVLLLLDSFDALIGNLKDAFSLQAALQPLPQGGGTIVMGVEPDSPGAGLGQGPVPGSAFGPLPGPAPAAPGGGG